MNRSFPASQVNGEILLVLGMLTRMRNNGFTQISFLMVIFTLSRMEAGVTDIAAWTAIHRNNVERIIRELRKDGIVEAAPCPKSNTGAVKYRLSDKGLKSLDDITGDLLKAATLLVQ